MPVSVIVRGGAGNVAPERRAEHVAGCERAVAAGEAIATLAARASNTETMTWAWGSTDGALESGW